MTSLRADVAALQLAAFLRSGFGAGTDLEAPLRLVLERLSDEGASWAHADLCVDLR